MNMRMSTASFYEDAVRDFNDMQASIAKSMKQISSGNKLTSPADNPSAAAQVLITRQASSLNTQYGVNRQNAATSLNTADGMLSGVTRLMQSLASQIVEAGSGALNASDKATMAQQFQSQLDQLMNLANSKDANGNYLFSGTATSTAPYATSSNGAQYNGNQVVQMLQADSSQQLAVTVAGSTIFGNIQVSPHAYFGTPDANNTSAAAISFGTVTDPAAVTLDNYSITFTSPTTYDITNTSTGASISTGNAYTSGAPITIAGVQFNIANGTNPAAPNNVPAAGDQFSVQPGKQNIFQALTNVITALKQPTVTAAGQTNFANSIAQANSSINASLNNVLTVRGQLGNSLQQIASLDNVGDTVGLAYQSALGTLENINLAETISKLSQEQLTYQTAQKAFATIAQTLSGLMGTLR